MLAGIHSHHTVSQDTRGSKTAAQSPGVGKKFLKTILPAPPKETIRSCGVFVQRWNETLSPQRRVSSRGDEKSTDGKREQQPPTRWREHSVEDGDEWSEALTESALICEISRQPMFGVTRGKAALTLINDIFFKIEWIYCSIYLEMKTLETPRDGQRYLHFSTPSRGLAWERLRTQQSHPLFATCRLQ